MGNFFNVVLAQASGGQWFAIAAAIAVALATVGPAIAQGRAASKAFDAIARQPEKANEIRTMLILALGFMEALTIYGLLVAFMIIGKIG